MTENIITKTVTAVAIDGITSQWQIATVINQPANVVNRLFIIAAPNNQYCAVTLEGLERLLEAAKKIEEEIVDADSIADSDSK